MGTARFSLLRILADGGLHSRERICRTLGLSAAELNEAAGDLAALGLRVPAAGEEMRLAERVDLYDRRLLTDTLRNSGLALEVLDECPSTNTELRGRAEAGAAHGTVLACEHQTAGRGRRGNDWVSAVGGSVTFSVLWRFSRSAGALSGLGLAVAVAAAEALEKLGVRGVALKWPNDLLHEGSKLGGILIETAGEAAGRSAVIVGVGVNVRLGTEARERIGRPVADLAACGSGAPSRTAVLGGLLESIAAALELFSREGFAPFRQAWLRRHAWQGRRVVLLGSGQRVEGEVIGIAADGALELACERGVERFHAGELSLRLG